MEFTQEDGAGAIVAALFLCAGLIAFLFYANAVILCSAVDAVNKIAFLIRKRRLQKSLRTASSAKRAEADRPASDDSIAIDGADPAGHSVSESPVYQDDLLQPWVPRPSRKLALKICLVRIILQTALSVFAYLLVSETASNKSLDYVGFTMSWQALPIKVIANIVEFTFSCLLLCAMLPTTFRRALAVTTGELLVGLIILAMLIAAYQHYKIPGGVF